MKVEDGDLLFVAKDDHETLEKIWEMVVNSEDASDTVLGVAELLAKKLNRPNPYGH